MSYEAERIAADILIAKLNTLPSYAASGTTNTLANDFQIIFNQVLCAKAEARESDLGKKHTS